jgi:hypothetical protein
MIENAELGRELRALNVDEIGSIAGGKKAVGYKVEKCPVKKDAEGNQVQTCKIIMVEGV